MTTPRQDIHIVPNFHYDVAYLKSHEDYLPTCMRNIIEALRILDAHPEYRFLIEQVILLEIFWNRHPEHRDTLVAHAQAGHLEVAPGMYVMPDMNHT
ncbi:MAG: alpha-mannosidase, partial [Victivallales bacterium]|nr:alpha-mannosidase [Victivallales bacterium]